LAKLIGLTAEDVYFLIERDGRVLQSAHRGNALGGHRTTPLKSIEVENEQIIEPELPITTAEHIHLVIDNTRRMELSHWCLSSNYGWHVKAKFVYALLQVYKDNI